METELYTRVCQFVDQAFTKSGNASTPLHLQRTVHWLTTFHPDAGEALMIAARSHDIERAFFQDEVTQMIKESDDGFENKELLRLHQTRGADIVGTFLKEQGADETLIARVQHLIRHHEEGGDKDLDALMDADTISFFENNVERFVKKHAVEQGRDKVIRKFRWMYERLSSDELRNIVRPWYEAALKRLG
jgi:hypothetical protein